MNEQSLIMGIITHPAFPVVSTLIGFLLGNFFAIGRDRRHDFNQAAKDFITAFQDELAMLRYESTTTYDIINPARIKHATAYYNFRRYLKGRNLENFANKWQIYYLSTPPVPDKETDQAYEDERIDLVKKIEDLFDFAKFK